MASEKQIAANRANAKRSTGPRTLAGKIVSSRNAFRHGLSGPLRLNPGTSVKVDAIARAIAGEEVDGERLTSAADFAELQLHLLHILSMRTELMAKIDWNGNKNLKELRRLAA